MLAFPALSQTGSVKIVNNTDYDIEVTMYGDATTSCSGASCNTTYITNVINVPNLNYPLSPTTWGGTDPCGISSGVGYALEACSTTWCPATLIPSDFKWTLAAIDIPSSWVWGPIFPLYVCPTQPSCSPGLGPVDGPHVTAPPLPTWSLVAKWTSSGGPMADVTITVDQY
jgi:hypothetical protein